ncbi:oxidoreductase [Sporormia fimetaria CBS 119925]|uniref:Oxidoreductase n=1 Tax=Sporormia fimetaria CBS 119925 TaxID=1340428 RepID=A0A6A6V9R8_9PLEO|nr:oxidoreductase [Sporormia fimetaria CBS 119925]
MEINTSGSAGTDDVFPDLPPFPDDVPTAPLLRLSLSNLRSSKDESDALFRAAKDLGFFYLDMRNDTLGETLLTESSQLFEVEKKMYALSEEELNRYDYSSIEPHRSYFGYKAMGKGVVDAKGNKDRNQFYNAPKDDFLDQSADPLAHPKPLMESKELLASYCRHAHELLSLLLTHINSHLRLEPGTLSKMHTLSLRSGDHIRFVTSPPQPPQDLNTSMGAHTDFGSLTLLFNRVGGLQVLLPEQGTFSYVRPLPGHAIVNVGDALVKFSGGIVRSNIHRVVAPPGAQSKCTRDSLVYFMRPGDNVLLVRCSGGIVPPLKEGEEEERVTSWEWIRDKAMSTRSAAKKEGVYGKQRVTNKDELKIV